MKESGESGIFNGEPDFIVKESYYSPVRSFQYACNWMIEAQSTKMFI